ncbi:MAG TPA: 30S ribosomal protein S16 [Patescibacteria group bacterium]
MLVIRLSRTGRTKRPHYRVVVAEKSAAVKGRYLEVLGHFDPRTKELKVDEERTKVRLKDGAQPSETAEMLLEKAGVLKRDKLKDEHRRPTRKKKKDIKAEAEGGDAPAKPADDVAASDDAAGDSKDDKPVAKDEAKKDEKPAAQPEEKAGADKPEAKKEDKDNEKGGS